MSEQNQTFSATGIEQLHLSASSGEITIHAEEREDILIESGGSAHEKIERKPDEEGHRKGFFGWKGHHDHGLGGHGHPHGDDGKNSLHMHSAKHGSANLVVRCPVGMSVVAGSASGTVRLKGLFGDVKVTTASGSIEIERARSVDLRTIAGNITVDFCEGVCRLSAVSGKSSVGSCQNIDSSSVSGKIEVADSTGQVKVRTVSGKVEVSTQGKGGVAVQTVSGGVTVAIPAGSRPSMRLSSLASRPNCDCPEGDDFEIKVKSMSGNIDVVPR